MKYACLALLLSLWAGWAQAECTAQVEVRDVIGPATVDLVKRAEAFADRESCNSILLLINTPGGSLDSTRLIVEMILNSPRPFLCLVSPSGGHAGSAGAIILQACHVSGAVQGTNLGAATPVALGQELGKDLRQKIMNDTRSWLESLTRLRGRSDKFGQEIIVDAKAVTAEDALKLGAIDFVGPTTDSFLKFAAGRTVKINEGREANVIVGELRPFGLDVRYKTLALLTDPELAYMLLLGSLGLLYFEVTHPGTFLPGVVGGVGLVISLMALHRLEVEWAGLILIFLGVGLLIAEMFLPTFGALGLGGVVALFLGSVFLFDPVKTGGYQLPYALILPVVVAFALAVVGLSIMLWRTRKVRKKGGYEDLIGLEARVTRLEEEAPTRGWIELQGETWKFESAHEVKINDAVRVIGHRGLILKVQRS
jgi:membrane-bound serine protease (ClpP class)